MILFNHNSVWNTQLLHVVCQTVGKRVNEWLTENWKQKKDNSLRAHQLKKLESKIATIIEGVCQSENVFHSRGYAGYEFRFKHWYAKSVCLELDILYYPYPNGAVEKVTEYVRLGPDWDYTKPGDVEKTWPVHEFPIDKVSTALKDVKEMKDKIDELRKQISSIKGEVGFNFFDKEKLDISSH